MLTDKIIKAVHEDIPNINSQLEQITNNIYYFSNFKGEGKSDDESFNDLIFKLHENNNPCKVIFNVPKLKITTPKLIKRGKLILDFNNCLVEWENYNSVGEDSGSLVNVGFISFKGDVTSELIGIEYKPSFDDRLSDCFVLENSGLKVGDYVYLRLGENLMLGNETDPITPYINRLVKINEIEGNKHYLDYSCPWEEIQNVMLNKSFINKVNVLKDITINNFKFIDNTILPGASKDIVSEYPGRHIYNNLVCGLHFEYVANVNANNCEGVKTTFPFLKFYSCNNVYVNNFIIDNPQIVGPGEGYGIQLKRCHNAYCNNLKGLNERHLIDLLESSGAIIENSVSNSMYQFGFSQHGAYEHSNLFKNCKGRFQGGNSGLFFGNATMNLTYENCSGEFYTKFTRNLKILNCNFSTYSFGTENTLVTNSTIKPRFSGEDFSIVATYLRGRKGIISFYNTSFVGFKKAGTSFIDKWENIEFNSCRFSMTSKDGVNIESRSRFEFVNNVNCDFINCKIGNIFIYKNNASGNYNFKGCSIKTLATSTITGVFWFTSLIESDIRLTLSDCDIIPNGFNLTLILVDINNSASAKGFIQLVNCNLRKIGGKNVNLVLTKSDNFNKLLMSNNIVEDFKIYNNNLFEVLGTNITI